MFDFFFREGIIIDSVISSEPLTDVEESSSTTNEEASSSTGDELADIIDSATDSDESVDKPVKTNINEIINDNENTDVENESTVIIKVKTVAIQENCSDIDNIQNNDKCKARFMIDENSSSNISNSNARVAADKMQSYKSLPISIRKFRAQNIPVENVLPSASSSSITPPADDESNTETVAAILLTLLYLFTVLFSWYYAVSNSTISEKANSVSQSPWIGQHNATKLIDQRLLLIQDRYEKVLGSDKWKLLRMSPNVTIETLSSEDGSWPLYIRTCAIFYAQPIDILKHLGWLQFDETQRKIDRFHESSHLLFAPSHKSKVIRKVGESIIRTLYMYFILIQHFEYSFHRCNKDMQCEFFK